MFKWIKNLTKRAFYQPAISLSSPDAFNYLGGRRSSSGQPIDRLSILSYPAVWRAINLVAGKVAKLPLDVYRKNKDGSRAVDDEHDAHWLLACKPSNLYTPHTFKKTLVAQALVHGSGFAWILRDEYARPTELVILNPETVGIGLGEGKLRYFVQMGTTQQIILPENMLHLKGLTHEGLIPYSVLDVLADSFGIGLAAQKFGSVFFKNDASGGVTILKFPQKMDQLQIDNLMRNWNKTHQGTDNAHKVAVLGNGGDISRSNLNLEQAQFIETRQFEVACGICNIFGVPAYKLGIPQATSYNSLEQSERAFLNDTLDDWLVSFEEECEAKLLKESQQVRGSHYIEFDRRSLEQADTKTQADTLIAMVNGGLMSENECRAELNLPAVSGADGDRMRCPSTITFIDLIAAKGDQALSANVQPAETTVGATDDEQEPVDIVSEVGIPSRFKKLHDATVKRLNERLRKAYDHAIEKRSDFDYEGHIQVFVESGLDYTPETARAYITDWVKEQHD